MAIGLIVLAAAYCSWTTIFIIITFIAFLKVVSVMRTSKLEMVYDKKS